jgi:hypothetical protein
MDGGWMEGWINEWVGGCCWENISEWIGDE